MSVDWERRLCYFLFLLLAAQVALAAVWFGGVMNHTRSLLFLTGVVASGVSVVLWIWRPVGTRQWPVAIWVVVLVMIWTTTRYLFADIEYVARQEWLLCLWAGSQLLVLYDLFRRRPEFATPLVLLMVVLAGFAAILAIFQYFGQIKTVLGVVPPEQYAGRGSGTFINPNHFAAFMELAFFPGLALLVFGRLGIVMRLILGYLIAIIAVGVVVSVSRGAFLSFGAGLFMFLVVVIADPKSRKIGGVVLVVLMVVLGAMIMRSHQIRSRLVQVVRVLEGRDDQSRLKIWESAWRIHQEAPWVGVGPAHFEFRYFNHRSPHYQRSAIRAHNDWLNVLVDYGYIGLLLGVLLFVLWFALLLRAIGRRQRKSRERGTRRSGQAIAVGAGISLVVLGFHAVVDFLIYMPALLILIAGNLALLTALTRSGGEGSSSSGERRNLVIWPRVVILALVTIPVVFYGTRLSREAFVLRAAKQSPDDLETQVRYFQRASEIEPKNDWTWHLLGEHHRRLSRLGEGDWEGEGERAVDYFEQAAELNEFRFRTWLRKGFALDWLGRPEEAGAAFDRAGTLDPNGAETMAWRGWHLFQQEDFEGARQLFLRSLNHLPAEENPLATTYLSEIRRRQQESR